MLELQQRQHQAQQRRTGAIGGGTARIACKGVELVGPSLAEQLEATRSGVPLDQVL